MTRNISGGFSVQKFGTCRRSCRGRILVVDLVCKSLELAEDLVEEEANET